MRQTKIIKFSLNNKIIIDNKKFYETIQGFFYSLFLDYSKILHGSKFLPFSYGNLKFRGIYKNKNFLSFEISFLNKEIEEIFLKNILLKKYNINNVEVSLQQLSIVEENISNQIYFPSGVIFDYRTGNGKRKFVKKNELTEEIVKSNIQHRLDYFKVRYEDIKIGIKEDDIDNIIFYKGQVYPIIYPMLEIEGIDMNILSSIGLGRFTSLGVGFIKFM